MTQDIRVCFVGDSFVNGTGDETALGWSGRLSSAAVKSGLPLTSHNLGIRRDTSKDILLRWKQECALRLPDFCDGRVVISCGVNDVMIEAGQPRVSYEESCSNIREILRGAKKYKVLMVGPPPVSEDDQNARILTISSAFAREARALTVPFIDLFSPLVLDKDYKREVTNNDGAHPRSAGYLKMANIVAASADWWFHPP
jgi:acyl-CoA thioesterase I